MGFISLKKPKINKTSDFMNMYFKKFIKIEYWIFIAIVFLHVLPILIFRHFPSMDGQAHLYNSMLLLETLKGNEFLSQFFTLNPALVPNWTGHVILMTGHHFFPAFFSEKILLIIYLVGLPLSFRYFIKSFPEYDIITSYLIFPFVYHFLFALGFYNYSLGLVLFFFILGLWQRRKHTLHWKDVLTFFLLFTLFYFTHVFVFVACGFLLVLWNQWDLTWDVVKSSIDQKLAFKYGKRFLVLLLSASGAIIIVFNQFLSGNSINPGGNVRYSFAELAEWILKTRPIVAYNYSHEGKFGMVLFFIFAFLLGYSLIKRLRLKKVFEQDTWLFSAFAICIIFFLVPNFLGGLGGHMSTRIGIIMYLTYIIWLAREIYPSLLKSLSVLGVVVISLLLVNYYARVLNGLNRDAKAIIEASWQIEENSVVLPVNLSDHWLQNHFSNYLGIDKPMIILENYEASSGGFPLVWNSNEMPRLLLGTLAPNKSCMNWISGNGKPYVIDYLFVWGTNDNECIDNIIRNVPGKIITHGIDTSRLTLYKIDKPAI